MDIDLRQIEVLAMSDLTKKEIALEMGISEKYWFKLAKEYTEIDQAFELGRMKKKKRVLNALEDKIDGGDMKAITFWLERKGGEEWKENKNVNVNVTVSKEHRLAAIESARQAIADNSIVDGDYKDITPEEWNS